MTIDLKWGLPFVVPVLLLLFIRFMVWFAGAEWSEPGMAVVFALFFGMPAGAVLAAVMENYGVHWHWTLGKPRG